MSQQNNQPSQWPKATVVILGTAAIGATAYFLNNADIMWALIALYWIVGEM